MSRFDPLRFVRVWQASSSPAAAARILGIAPESARVQACRLRKAGVRLKRFRRLNVKALNRAAKGKR